MSISHSTLNQGRDMVLTITQQLSWDAFKDFSEASKDLGNQISRLTVDLSALQKIDHAGIGMLLLLRQQAQACGAQVTLRISSALKTDDLFANHLERLFDCEITAEAVDPNADLNDKLLSL